MKSFVVSLFGVLSLAMHLGCCCGPMGGHCGHALSTANCGMGCNSGCDAGYGFGGLNLRGRLASRLQMAHCNSGCGEVYWDEQINERPICDPCGCNNEFAGGVGCDRCPGALHRLRQLWGFRYTPSDCSTCSSGSCEGCGNSGCSSCGSADQVVGNDVHSMHSHPTTTSTMSQTNDAPPAKVRSEPTPAKPPVPAADIESTGEPAAMTKPRNQRIEVGSGRRAVPATTTSSTTTSSKARMAISSR